MTCGATAVEKKSHQLVKSVYFLDIYQAYTYDNKEMG